jgi:hypothetical protein
MVGNEIYWYIDGKNQIEYLFNQFKAGVRQI